MYAVQTTYSDGQRENTPKLQPKYLDHPLVVGCGIKSHNIMINSLLIRLSAGSHGRLRQQPSYPGRCPSLCKWCVQVSALPAFDRQLCSKLVRSQQCGGGGGNKNHQHPQIMHTLAKRIPTLHLYTHYTHHYT